MKNLSALLSQKLKKRAEIGALRSLTINNYTTDFYSNDYLGLAKEENQLKANLHSGTGSRLISGTTATSLNVEQFLANTWKSESALIFNSGYDANLGLIITLADRSTTILYDEHIHASARDGIQLSKAKAVKFKHNDLDHLASLLAKTKGICIVFVESIYSMHGDFCDLERCVKICNQFNAELVVDEAHAAGIYGRTGGGRIEALGIENLVFARIITFGKGLGAHGACVLSSKIVVESLINFARSFIYTTALPESAYLRIKQIVTQTDFKVLQKKLRQNIEYFNGNKTPDYSAIQIWQPKSIKALKQKEALIKEAGIGVKAIYSPTVKKGEERLRICLHVFNTKEEIDTLKSILD